MAEGVNIFITKRIRYLRNVQIRIAKLLRGGAQPLPDQPLPKRYSIRPAKYAAEIIGRKPQVLRQFGWRRMQTDAIVNVARN